MGETPGRGEPPATWRELWHRVPSRRFGKAVAAVAVIACVLAVLAGVAVVVFVAAGVLF